MSFIICDIDGYVGDLATNTGLVELRNWLLNEDEIFQELFEYGMTTDIEILQESLTEIKQPDDINIKKTLANMLDIVSKCKEVVIITDGIGVE